MTCRAGRQVDGWLRRLRDTGRRGGRTGERGRQTDREDGVGVRDSNRQEKDLVGGVDRGQKVVGAGRKGSGNRQTDLRAGVRVWDRPTEGHERTEGRQDTDRREERRTSRARK